MKGSGSAVHAIRSFLGRETTWDNRSGESVGVPRPQALPIGRTCTRRRIRRQLPCSGGTCPD